MLDNILLAITVSFSFLIGAILYIFTREEIDPILKKYSNPTLTKMKHFGLVPVGFLGLILSLFTNHDWIIPVSLIIFLIGIIFGSFVLNHKENKIVLKYAGESIGIFLLYFFGIFILANLNLFI